jgi:hypothetical protein
MTNIVNNVVAEYHHSHYDLVKKLTTKTATRLLFRSYVTGAYTSAKINADGTCIHY